MNIPFLMLHQPFFSTINIILVLYLLFFMFTKACLFLLLMKINSIKYFNNIGFIYQFPFIDFGYLKDFYQLLNESLLFNSYLI